jgi:hypothetical protein
MSDKKTKRSWIKHLEAYAATLILATGTIYAVLDMGRLTLGVTVVLVYFCARTITKSFK